MKRFDARSFVSGALITAMLFGGLGTAFAKTAAENIKVYFNDIKVMIDGKQFTPRDEDGTVLEPFTYNGRTYLPVRSVGEALGQKVNWDAKTSTVILGEYDAGESLYPDVNLWELDYLDKNNSWDGSDPVKDNFGNSYNGYIAIGGLSNYGVGFMEYALNGQYSKLKARQILNYNMRTYESKGAFTIKVDGKTVKTLDFIQAGEEPVDFEIDLAGANRLRIESNSFNSNYFVDAGLYK
ncbi:stalk domain-containing protein [Bacilliculturomica massiliensis]|uniref:stalk domain-containing protein n=1 Tax=Bacilliculturomica massiliensis TaxID=1917867 RepID=UPI00103125E6|nr:stalk domain-containing protein [Bacilliculturomica massiliensis]